MNWQAAGAIGEILGAFGVIVTLAYLAVQLRQNTQALKLNAEFAAAQEHLHNSVDLCGTTVPYVVFRGFEKPSSLTPEESAQFLFWLNGSVRMYQHHHLMFLEGTLSPASWSSTEQLLKGIIQTDGFKKYSSLRKNSYGVGFQTMIEDLDTTGVVSSANLVGSISRSNRDGDA